MFKVSTIASEPGLEHQFHNAARSLTEDIEFKNRRHWEEQGFLRGTIVIVSGVSAMREHHLSHKVLGDAPPSGFLPSFPVDSQASTVRRTICPESTKADCVVYRCI